MSDGTVPSPTVGGDQANVEPTVGGDQTKVEPNVGDDQTKVEPTVGDDQTKVEPTVQVSQNEEIERQRDNFKQERDAFKEELDKVREELKGARKDKEKAFEELTDTKAELEETTKKKEDVEKDLRKQLADVNVTLEKGKTNANDEIERLRSELKLAEAKIDSLTQVEGLGQPGISVTPGSSYLCRSIIPTTDDASSSNPAVFSHKRLWPNGQIITYTFVDGHTNQHTKVTEIIPEWSRYANVTFKSVPSKALLVISFKNTWECWSHIGTDAHTTTAEPPYTMALGPVRADSPYATRGDRALILHQFGHVLGLVHEHMCPAETDAKSLKQNEILNHPSFQGLDSSSIGKYSTVYARSSVTNYAAPDLSSIMIFSMPGELNEGNLTIEPNIELSPLDKAFMVINYPRAHVHSQASEWTLRHALMIANVDEHTARAITETHDNTKRRILFANFLSAARERHPATFVDPAPEIVDNLRLPAVRAALNDFFTDLEGHPPAKEILADLQLKEDLITLLNRLTAHHTIREIVQQGKANDTDETPKYMGDEPAFVGSLLNVALMLHGADQPKVHPAGHNGKDAKLEASSTVTALCAQLARHTAFRVAMERAIKEDAPEIEALPDVSGLVEKLAQRPGVLRAVRHALQYRV